MKCLITECANHADCTILGITKKQPKDSKSCSYFKTPQQVEKKIQKDLQEPKTKKKKER